MDTFLLRMDSNEEGEIWSNSQHKEPIKHKGIPDHPGHGNLVTWIASRLSYSSWPDITLERASQEARPI